MEVIDNMLEAIARLAFSIGLGMAWVIGLGLVAIALERKFVK